MTTLSSTPIAKQKIAGLVLAGGRSRRFGSIDKGLQLWRGLPLTEHVVRRLAPQVSKLTISCNNNLQRYQELSKKYRHPYYTQYQPLILRDSVLPANNGPLSGIFALLDWYDKKTNHEGLNTPSHIMVCSCDSPVIPQGLVNDLAKHLDQTDSSAAYPIVDGDHARLLLLLEVETATQAMRQTLNEFCEQPANLSVKYWLKRLNTSTLPLSGDGIGININYPSDLAKLEQQGS
jgi:molybdopterin-guanine dinucleotide biosynthesis protein A